MIADKLPGIKGLIIDMDGVLWHDTEPLGDLPAIFAQIRDHGYQFILATNNATRTVKEYVKKLASFGVQLREDQIINSAQAVGIYLQKRYRSGPSVFVVGESSLKQTLSDYGCQIVDESASMPQVVVASLDYELTYQKLSYASLAIQAGSVFIGTNPDTTFPTPDGLLPGSGMVIGALEISTGQKAKIIGKPEPLLYEMAVQRLGLSAEETLGIGDRLETDIAGAQSAGIHAALVLSGVSSQAQAEAWTPAPDIIVPNMTELIF